MASQIQTALLGLGLLRPHIGCVCGGVFVGTVFESPILAGVTAGGAFVAVVGWRMCVNPRLPLLRRRH